MTRPRKRKNADNFSGFTVIDPGGNWIRIMASMAGRGDAEATPSRLSRMLQNAVVMGDSHGYDARAMQILDDALDRDQDTAPATDLVEALAYRAELALREGDPSAAVDAITRARKVTLSDAERDRVAETLAGLEDLAAIALN
jgi:hypothetical protein